MIIVWIGGDAYGGAIFCTTNSNPRIGNCTVTDNKAVGGNGADGSLAGVATEGGDAYGGALYGGPGCNPILEDCNIVGNTISGGDGGSGHYCAAEDAGDVYGAGICCGRDSTVMIYRCKISNNQATGGTGGYGEGGDPGSSGGNAYGGGVYCGADSQLAIGNCNIVGNIASGGRGWYRTPPPGGSGGNGGNSHGGGVCCDTDSGSEIGNSTIAGNRALGGKGGIGESRSASAGTDGHNGDGYGAGIYYDANSVGAITDSIVWGNEGDAIYGNRLDVTYSDIEGGWPGEGNIDLDPCFASPGYWAANDPKHSVEPNDPNAVWIDGDYHVKSQAGRWDPNSQTWVLDDVTSPCIDAGDPDSDWAAEPWPHGKRINMGAYGDTGQASMSLSSIGNIADLNNNDRVDYADMRLLTSDWPCEKVLLHQDLDRNGIVSFADFAIFADNWLWGQ